MRTARRVIVCLLVLSVHGVLAAQQAAPDPPNTSMPSAQGSVDTDVTVTGGDDSVIPIPPPAPPDDAIVLPALDPGQPPSFIVPPVTPLVRLPPAPPVLPQAVLQ